MVSSQGGGKFSSMGEQMDKWIRTASRQYSVKWKMAGDPGEGKPMTHSSLSFDLNWERHLFLDEDGRLGRECPYKRGRMAQEPKKNVEIGVQSLKR